MCAGCPGRPSDDSGQPTAEIDEIGGVGAGQTRQAVLTPGHPRTKEWAYAGLVFVYSGAAASHVAAGDGPDKWAMPVFFAAATFAARARLPRGGYADQWTLTDRPAMVGRA
ncbi:DoxX family protein [Nocardia sp. NPDC004573]